MIKLVNTSGKHNKFWMASISPDYTVTCKWGRLGSTGQSKDFPQSSQYQAESYIRDKVSQKNRKGYMEVGDKTFDLHVFRGALVGAGAKIDYICWVKRINQPGAIHDLNTNWKAYPDKLYEEVTDVAEISNPEYEPTIYARIRFTGNRGSYSLIITLDSVEYSSYDPRSARLPMWSKQQYQPRDLQKITDQSPKILRNLKKQAAGMVQSLL